MRRQTSTCAIALCLGLSLVAAAAHAADARRGEDLAMRWCSNCHQVGSSTPAQDAVPPLREVASRSYATRDWLTG